MNRHLLMMATITVFATLALLAGCARRDRAPEVAPVPADSFVRAWQADLKLQGDRAERLFLRDDLLLLYTRDNEVFVFSAAGGELLWRSQVTSPRSELRAPTIVGDKIVIPTISTFEIYNRDGRRLESVSLERATRSAAGTGGNVLYIGLDYRTGGRLAKIDINRQYGRTLWELMTFGSVTSAPVVYEDVVYAASGDGRVYAINSDRTPVWSMEGNTFRTAGPVEADLRVDDYAVYVASTDGKLYALDRANGRIKWQYFAGVPLRTAPVVTADRVYLSVPGRGLVALNKTEGESFREPLWTARRARQFLSTDDANVYALAADGSLMALDRNTGKLKFQSDREDFVARAVNTRDATMYATTEDGKVFAVKPVLRAGTVGAVVRSDRPASDTTASAR